jgi:N-acetylglucosamine kinase-like BadF-type ATPase
VIKQAVAYYLGIDGGGSKTACLVGDETSILGRGDGTGSNIVRLGEQAAREALQQSVLAACANAKIDARRISRTVAGVAGVGRAEVREFMRETLREIVAGEIIVVTDVEAALDAAFANGPGVVVVSGTGSIAFARNSQNETSRAGGWGWAISDEGSGSWIGRAAVTAVFCMRDAGQSAQMEQTILRAWQLTDHQQLVSAANATPQPDFGALLPEVVAAANSGDSIAAEVFLRAGRELAALAKIVVSRVFAADANVPVAMSGGAFAHAPNLREAFYNSLQAQLPHAVLLPDLADPVLGALQMARRARPK